MQTATVAVASWGPGHLDIFALDVDSHMFHKAWNGNAWFPSKIDWEPLGGTFDSPPAAVSWGPNRVDIFAIDANIRMMLHKAWDGNAWFPSQTGWEPLGGNFNSPPAVVSWGPHRLDIFALGADNHLLHKAWDGHTWFPSQTEWEPLGGPLNSPPAVVSWGPNRLDIFALGPDNQMLHKAWDGNAWFPSKIDWEPLGGTFDSPPAAVSWGPNRLDIFALGTDDQMFHKAWNNGWHPSPTEWDPMGGKFDSPPAVVSWGPNRLDIFGLWTDDQMVHKAWDDGWYPSELDWDPLDGKFHSPPAAIAWGPNRLDIFGLGTDDEMYHKGWEGGWNPSPGWAPLGGKFKIPAPMPAVPFPTTGLGSNSNYILYSNCTPLFDLSVSIDVTEDIVCASSSGKTFGFSFQLNAYSPKNAFNAYQQFVIALFENKLRGIVQTWSVNGGQNTNIINRFVEMATLPNAVIPAGSRLIIRLQNDNVGNIVEATFYFVNNQGKTLASETQTLIALLGITEKDLAPIVAFEFNLVGPINLEDAVLSSGAGKISYVSSNVMTVLNHVPACTEVGFLTSETANSRYGAMPLTASKMFTQSFHVSSSVPTGRKPGK